MTITYRIRFRDRLAFAAYVLPRNPLIFFMVVGFFLFVNFKSVLPAIRQEPADKPLVVTFIAAMIIEFLLATLVVAFFAAIIVLTMISRKNKPLYCQRTLTVRDEMFVTESEYGRSETKWSLVQKLVRTRRHIFMFLNAQSAIIVPRNVFENGAQWDAFYEACSWNKRRITGNGQATAP